MKIFLAAVLSALPLAVLASDPAPASTTNQPAETAEHEQPAESKPAEPKAADAKPAVAKPAAAKAKAKADAKVAGKPAVKKDEKPCEPVKPCSID